MFLFDWSSTQHSIFTSYANQTAKRSSRDHSPCYTKFVSYDELCVGEINIAIPTPYRHDLQLPESLWFVIALGSRVPLAPCLRSFIVCPPVPANRTNQGCPPDMMHTCQRRDYILSLYMMSDTSSSLESIWSISGIMTLR